MRADEVTVEVVAGVAGRVVAAVGGRRSTWRRWNLLAETARQTMGWRFDTIEDREAVVTRITDAAERASMRLTPPELASSPAIFRREDGSTRFRQRHSRIYSSAAVLDAEDRLLALGRDTSGPALPPAARASVAAAGWSACASIESGPGLRGRGGRRRRGGWWTSWSVLRVRGRRPPCARSATGGKWNMAAALFLASPLRGSRGDPWYRTPGSGREHREVAARARLLDGPRCGRVSW